MADVNADFILLQETKINFQIADEIAPNFSSAWSFSEVIGYAGVAAFFKNPPQRIVHDFPEEKFCESGRVLTLEYEDFFLINVYVPNSQGTLDRWYARLDFDEILLKYLGKLAARKHVIVGGDFNVAHKYEDIYPENTKNLEQESGFRAEERGNFDNLLDSGFVDTFRLFRSGNGNYTWWSCGNRNENKGRRLDYFLVTESLKPKITRSEILQDVVLSDHAPILLDIKM